MLGLVLCCPNIYRYIQKNSFDVMKFVPVLPVGRKLTEGITYRGQKNFEYDVWYVDHLSLGLDLKIMFLTVKKVFVREGISKEGEATTVLF